MGVYLSYKIKSRKAGQNKMKKPTTRLMNLELGTIIKMRTKRSSYETTLGVVFNSLQVPAGMTKVYQLESLFDVNYEPALYGDAVEVEVA